MDRITLKGLRGRGFHGVFEHERIGGQDFIVDVILYLDSRLAAEKDDLNYTANTGVVAEQILSIISGDPVNLIETLAQRIAEQCLSNRAVEQVEVTVHKPYAPIAVFFEDASITINRSRMSEERVD
ncbi:dihydroneopterin aldolase [Streptomyces sp. NPDC058701]|uniref:dihydroneopterin aldolase n=1 Tax=Streptomyces sp. NPDC058701 TaxID=3346608 RepID=UPI003665CCB1